MANHIIRDPERYFNRYIACEIKNDRRKAAEIREAECSLDEKLEAGGCPRELTCNLNDELFDSVGGFLGNIENMRLHAALLTLSPEQLELIKMVCAECLNQREIAEMLGTTQNSVYWKYKTALKRLRKYF